jgi:DNA-binding CsgD family transcriptional regulator
VAKVAPVHDLAMELGVTTMAHRLATHVVRLALAAGDQGLAAATTRIVEGYGGPGAPRSFQGAAAYCRGLLDDDGDRLLAAADHYREVSPIDFVLSAEAAGRRLDGADRRDEATVVLEEGLGWCEKLGADVHGRAISALLAAWSGPKDRSTRYHDRPVSGWESLTPAERGVALLVGEGLSNAEMADRLFISRRTVESHLAHVYQKLQIKGRVALALEVASLS